MKRWEEVLAHLPTWALDLALGVALAIVDVATLLPYRRQFDPLGLALGLVVLQNLPLVWRRTRPLTMFVAIGGARLAYDLIGFGMAPLPLGPALAVYTVADRSGPKARWAVFVLLAAGLAVSQASPGRNQPYDAIEAVLIFATAWLAGWLSRARRRYLAEVETRVVATQAAAVEERENIARDLHDIVAHHVSVMAVQAEAAMSLLPGRPDDAAGAVEVIGSTARQAMTELRQLLSVLRRNAEPVLREPMASLSTVAEVIERVRSAGLSVNFDIVGQPRSLSPLVEANACRIVQEALTNTLRHSRAAQAAVVVTYDPEYLTVNVSDSAGPNSRHSAGRGSVRADKSDRDGDRDGGFEVYGGPRPGFGLAGIAERVTSCGGSLSVGPRGAGFEVVARLPAQ